jgi:hypothetical protein
LKISSSPPVGLKTTAERNRQGRFNTECFDNNTDSSTSSEEDDDTTNKNDGRVLFPAVVETVEQGHTRMYIIQAYSGLIRNDKTEGLKAHEVAKKSLYPFG